jgi:hypothetical protein
VTPTPTPAPVKPSKKTNTISVKLKKKTIKLNADTIAKKSKKYARKKYLSVNNPKGTVRYKITSVNKSRKRFSINSKNGRLTIKKGLKAGNYKVNIKVTASGNSSYKYGSDSVTLKVVVSKEKLKVSGKSVTAEGTILQTEDVTFAKSDILKISNSGGKQSFSITGADSSVEFFAIDEKGNLTVKSGIAAGTYKVKVQVKTAGSGKYKAGKKTATVTVTVTPAQSEVPDQTDTPSDANA